MFAIIKQLFIDGTILKFCAWAGTGMLAIQSLLMFVGAEHDSQTIQDNVVFEDGKFRWMAKQTLTAFLMMFGWIGLACKEQFHLPLPFSLIIATGAGIAASIITSLIFHLVKKAHSSGTVFTIDETLGYEAIVYHRISKNGIGKIILSFHEFTYEIDATSKEEIESFTKVQIVKKLDHKTVIVRR